MDSNFIKISKTLCENNSDLYLDYNYFSQKETRIVVDKENTEISKDSDLGIKIRIWDGEKFIENATTNLDDQSIKNSTEDLIEKYNHSIKDIENKKELKINTEKIEKQFSSQIIDSISKLSLEEKTDKLKKLKDEISKIDGDILNVKVALVDTYEKHEFVNLYKSFSQEITLIKLVLDA